MRQESQATNLYYWSSHAHVYESTQRHILKYRNSCNFLMLQCFHPILRTHNMKTSPNIDCHPQLFVFLPQPPYFFIVSKTRI